VVSKPLITDLFFTELKQYNNNSFKMLHTADLKNPDAQTIKAYSSTITRYFIFTEKHPEIGIVEKRMLYFALKLDTIARYFSEFPNGNAADLAAFQQELQRFIENQEGATVND